MQLHVKVGHQSKIVFDDYQDVNALRVMADIVLRALHEEMRGTSPSNHERQRAYQIALMISNEVPENTRV